MKFSELLNLINTLSVSKQDFYTVSKKLEEKIFSLSKTDLKNMILLKKNCFLRQQILYWQKHFKNLA